jgi:MFS family permease
MTEMTNSANGQTNQNGKLAPASIIAAAFTGLAVGYPSSYGATATTFILPLTSEFGWGRTIPSLMFVSSMLGIAIASLWLGKVIERYGEARVCATSGLCMAIVMGCLANIEGTTSVAIGLCFFAGALGSGTGVGLYLSILPKWFDRGLGRALAISVLGQSVGITLMPAFAATIIADYGWRNAYYALAALQLLFTLATAAALWMLEKSDHGKERKAGAQAYTGLSIKEAVATRSFWILSAIVFLVTMGVFGPAIHIFPLYADKGLATDKLPMVVVALGMGSLVGRLSSGILLDYLDARIVACITFLTGAVAILWIALAGSAQDPIVIYIPPFLLGLALGAETDILAYMVRRFYGLLHYAAIYNRLLIPYYLGAVTGPMLVGWATDHHVGQSFIIGLACSCIMAAVAVFALSTTKVR